VKIDSNAHAGFTLIEMVIAAAIMALVLAGAYACLSAGFAGQKMIEPRIEVYQNARAAMAVVSADLRSACALPGDSPFLGMRRAMGEIPADNLDFATHNYRPGKDGEGDFCEESLFLQPDSKSGDYSLWRRRNPRIALDPLAGGNREEIATGLRGLRFEYYDGFDWYDSWGDTDKHSGRKTAALTQGNLSGMPEAVRITLWFDGDARKSIGDSAESLTNSTPLIFQTVARLELAGRSDSGSSTGTPGSSGDGGMQRDAGGDN
jgi:prepilin-type N-terminal cleavage/methylation domain-containing protein